MLKIEISNQRKVNAFKSDFNELFPHLEIQLYYKSAPRHAHSKHAHLHREHFAEKPRDFILDCREQKNEGTLEFHAEMTIQQFKDLLNEKFGLHCEIYQHVGKGHWSTLPVPAENPLYEANFEIH